MDGKHSQKVGEAGGAGDSRYLQHELGQVLPAALAFITELQPPDPITALALWLYKYRDLNPLPVPSPVADVWVTAADLSSQEPSTIRLPTIVTESAVVDTPKMRPVQICQRDVEDFDDFIEDTGYSDSTLQRKADVHCDIVPVFTDIGDLFDDGDLR
ncbi:hypothetical protein ACOMHN_013834 [Nucella lapillus]